MRARAIAHYQEGSNGYLELSAALPSFLWRSLHNSPLTVVPISFCYFPVRNFQVCVGNLVSAFCLEVPVQVL